MLPLVRLRLDAPHPLIERDGFSPRPVQVCHEGLRSCGSQDVILNCAGVDRTYCGLEIRNDQGDVGSVVVVRRLYGLGEPLCVSSSGRNLIQGAQHLRGCPS